jgi:hypothetical protein
MMIPVGDRLRIDRVPPATRVPRQALVLPPLRSVSAITAFNASGGQHMVSALKTWGMCAYAHRCILGNVHC